MIVLPETPADCLAPQRSSARACIIVLCTAAALRMLWLVLVPVAPLSDPARYDFFAQRLANGLGYTESDGRPTAYFSVGPSFLYSLVYRVTGTDSPARLTGVAWLNWTLGVASVWLTLVLARRWFDARIAVTAAFLLAVWPSQIQFTTVLSSETPMIFFMLAALVVWNHGGSRFLLRSALAGVLFAAAAYMRPTALLLPLIVIMVRVLADANRMRTIVGGTIALAALISALSPWFLRNERVFGEFVLLSTAGGPNFWMGNNPRSDGEYMPLPPDSDCGDEAARSRRLRAEAVVYIADDPMRFAWRTCVKAIRLHERESIGIVWNSAGLDSALGVLSADRRSLSISALKLISSSYWWFVLAAAALGAVGLVVSMGRWPDALLPCVIWIYFTLVHAVTVIQDRYHFASIPFIAMLAALGLRSLWNWLLLRRSGQGVGQFGLS